MTPKQIEKELNRQMVLFDHICQANAGQSGHIKFAQFFDRYMEEYATPISATAQLTSIEA